MGPIDYSTQVQNPFASALQGYQAGTAVRQDQAQQTALQVQRQQQLQMQQDLYNLSQKAAPSGQDYAALMTRYPTLSKQLGESWQTLDTAQQKSKLAQGTQAYAAIRSGRPDIAEQLFRDRSEAAEAAGDTQASKEFKSMADLIKLDPKNAATSVGLSLAAHLGPEKFAQTYATLGQEQRAGDKFPTDMRKDRAEATTAEATAGIKSVEAVNAPTRVGLENANIESTIQDRAAGQAVAQGQLGVAQENAMTGRGNLTLEQQKLAATMGEKKKTESLAAQDQIDTINSSLSSVQALAKHPSIDSMVGSYTGKLNSNIPGSSRKDIEALVDTVKSQQFLTGIKQMAGMGALSNAEGDKIGSAVASLSLDQSPKAFKTALGVIQSTLERAQAKAVASGKLPDSGGAFVMKIPRIGNVNESDINKLLTKNPGSTREQAIRYLESLSKSNGGATGGY